MKYRPEYDRKLIGRNLRRCRQAKNLPVEQVKEYLCIGSIQAIYKWEEGKSYPQTDTMFALMELYGIGLQDLLCKENQTVPEENVKNYQIYPQTEIAQSSKEGRMKRLLRYFRILRKDTV